MSESSMEYIQYISALAPLWHSIAIKFKEKSQKCVNCQCGTLQLGPKWKPNEHKRHFIFIGGDRADQSNI